MVRGGVAGAPDSSGDGGGVDGGPAGKEVHPAQQRMAMMMMLMMRVEARWLLKVRTPFLFMKTASPELLPLSRMPGRVIRDGGRKTVSGASLTWRV